MHDEFARWMLSLTHTAKVFGIASFAWAGVLLNWISGWPWGVMIGAAASIYVAHVTRDARRKEDAARIRELETEVAILAAKVATGSHV